MQSNEESVINDNTGLCMPYRLRKEYRKAIMSDVFQHGVAGRTVEGLQAHSLWKALNAEWEVCLRNFKFITQVGAYAVLMVTGGTRVLTGPEGCLNSVWTVAEQRHSVSFLSLGTVHLQKKECRDHPNKIGNSLLSSNTYSIIYWAQLFFFSPFWPTLWLVPS